MKGRSQYHLALASCLGLASCASGTTAPARDSIRVVAVERVYGDLVRQLAGDANVSVTTILNSPTADPHAYEPTPRDADAVASADLVIENGLGYDAFADKLLAASPRSGRTVVDAGALGGHRVGDNPHVWYEMRTLARTIDAIAADLSARVRARAVEIGNRRARLDAWTQRLAARLVRLGRAHPGASVAITEPVFDYVLDAARLRIATPRSFSHAIEEGNDPAPQDVDAMRALLGGKHVDVFVYNSQTVEPSTRRLLDVAAAARVPVVPVTETLPAGQTTQTWIEGEVGALERAL
jgi:zinc/manganese transport system substrate-binding protein